MYWFWKVRIHRADGQYVYGVVKTDRNLEQIDTIQDFYFALTGSKMLLEGMAENREHWGVCLSDIKDSFHLLFKNEKR